VREPFVIHWKDGDASANACGAPAEAFGTTYPHTVTCQRCIAALKKDLGERRLAAHRMSTLPHVR
jgi:hypothetical protein